MIRNQIIYLAIAIAALFLVSRLVTLALVLAYAPDDAGRFFYLQNSGLALVAVIVIFWLWRNRRDPDAE